MAVYTTHPRSRESTPPWWWSVFGVRLAVVFWLGLVAVAAVRDVLPPAAAVPAATGLIAVLVVAMSYGQGAAASITLAVTGWALVTGFVVHDFGELGPTSAGDCLRLLILVLVAVAASRRSLLDASLTRRAPVPVSRQPYVVHAAAGSQPLAPAAAVPQHRTQEIC